MVISAVYTPLETEHISSNISSQQSQYFFNEEPQISLKTGNLYIKKIVVKPWLLKETPIRNFVRSFYKIVKSETVGLYRDAVS